MAAVVSELRRNPVPAPWILAVGVLAVGVALITGFGIWVLALAILVPTTIAVQARPQRGIILFSALLPFDGIIRALGPAWTAPWKQVFILGLLALTFFCPADARAQVKRKLPGWTLAFAGLVAMGLVSALRVDTTTALVGLRLSFFSAFLGLVVWRCPFNRRERDHLVTAFILLAIVTSIVGLWQQAVGHEYLRTLGYEYGDHLRFTSGFTLRSISTFNLPFPFGFYLMLAILIALPMSLADPKRLRSKIFFVSLPLLAAGLLFSFVRGAMLGLAIGLLYLAFHRYKVLVYGIPLVLLATLFIPTGAAVGNALFSTKSFQDRTFSWSDRIDFFADAPLGTGIGTTGAAAEKAAELNFQDPDTTYVPDSSWLKILFELGVFGLWLFVVMLMSILVFARNVERRCRGIDRDLMNGIVAQLLAIMTAALVATYFELAPMDQLFWVMLGVAATIEPELAPGAPIAGEGARALDAGL